MRWKIPSRLGQLFLLVLLFGLLVSFLFFSFFFFCLQLKSQPDIYFKINILHKKTSGKFNRDIPLPSCYNFEELKLFVIYVCLQCLAKLRMDKYYTYKCQVSYFQECCNAPNVNTLCKIINKNLQIFKKCRE